MEKSRQTHRPAIRSQAATGCCREKPCDGGSARAHPKIVEETDMDSCDGPVPGKLGDGEPAIKEPDTRQRIQALLDEQPFAVLCTQGGGQHS